MLDAIPTMRTLSIWLVALLAFWLPIRVSCAARQQDRSGRAMLLPCQSGDGVPDRPSCPVKKAVLADANDREDEGCRLCDVPGNVLADVATRRAGLTTASLFDGPLSGQDPSSPLYLSFHVLLI